RVASPGAQAAARSIALEAPLEAPSAALSAPFPAAPTRRAAPTQSPAPVVAAPVPARAVPTVRVPAMTPAEIDVLALLDRADGIGRHADRVRIARLSFRAPDHGAAREQRCDCRACENQSTHGISWVDCDAQPFSPARRGYGEKDCPNYVRLAGSRGPPA